MDGYADMEAGTIRKVFRFDHEGREKAFIRSCEVTSLLGARLLEERCREDESSEPLAPS